MNLADLVNIPELDIAKHAQYLVALRDRAREGYVQEKASAKEGVVPIVECYPAIELSATKELVAIAKWVYDRQSTSGQSTSIPNVTIVFEQTDDIP